MQPKGSRALLKKPKKLAQVDIKARCPTHLIIKWSYFPWDKVRRNYIVSDLLPSICWAQWQFWTVMSLAVKAPEGTNPFSMTISQSPNKPGMPKRQCLATEVQMVCWTFECTIIQCILPCGEKASRWDLTMLSQAVQRDLLLSFFPPSLRSHLFKWQLLFLVVITPTKQRNACSPYTTSRSRQDWGSTTPALPKGDWTVFCYVLCFLPCFPSLGFADCAVAHIALQL